MPFQDTKRAIVQFYIVEKDPNKQHIREVSVFKGGDLDVCDKERGKPLEKFTDDDLQSLLDGNAAQTDKELAELLNVTQAAISKRLHVMGKFHKEGKWLTRELSECAIIKRFNVVEKTEFFVPHRNW